jgi:hypothetical protein
METTDSAKNDIVTLLSDIYGAIVGELFQTNHRTEVIPVFVHSSYLLLKQNMGQYKASEELDKILSRHGVSVSSYD